MASLFGVAKIAYIAAKDTVSLASAKRSDDDGQPSQTKTTLLEVVKKSIVPCRLNPFLFNGHLQTVWVTFGRHTDLPIHYKRMTFDSDTTWCPGTFAVDFMVDPLSVVEGVTVKNEGEKLPPRTLDFSEQERASFVAAPHTKPLVIILHGLSGGSQEQYLRHTAAALTKDTSDFDVCVINGRGCGWTKVTTPYLFNARLTCDLRQFVKWLKTTWPERKLYAIGYSLGANILGNYLGEEGGDCQIDAAMLVGNPWNLDVSNTLLENSFIGKYVYLRALAGGVKRIFANNVNVMRQNEKIDVEKGLRSTFLYEWDRGVQCNIWGYPTEHSYYRDASCVDVISNIRIPVLALHSTDDPVCKEVGIPYKNVESNPFVVLCTTSLGGHLGWFEIGGGRWYTRVATNFFHNMLRETAGVPSPPSLVSGQWNPLRRRWQSD